MPSTHNGTGSYSGASYNGVVDDEAAEDAFPAQTGGVGDLAAASGIGAAPVSQPPVEPESSPFAAPSEYPGAVSQEGAAPSYSEDFSYSSDASYAAPAASATARSSRR